MLIVQIGCIFTKNTEYIHVNNTELNVSSLFDVSTSQVWVLFTAAAVCVSMKLCVGVCVCVGRCV